jgi:hypothetical protein
MQCLRHVPSIGLIQPRMSANESRRHTASRLEIERDSLGMINGEGMITGTVVSAAVIAAAAGHLEETRLVFAILGTAFVYWLTHLHA